jgi:cell division protein FtsA
MKWFSVPLQHRGQCCPKMKKKWGVLLLDLGAGTSDMLVFLEGAPYHSSVMNIGSRQITSDLSIMLKTPWDAAEKIKKDSGCAFVDLVDDDETVIIPPVGGWPSAAVPRREVTRIIQSRMTEMYEMVKADLIKKRYMEHLGGGIVLTGGGALLPGAAELASTVFGIPARIGRPLSSIHMIREYQRPDFSAALVL